MLLRLNREHNPIKAGWSSSAPLLGVAAHGFSQEVADLNLKRTVRYFLSPFERAGTLLQELATLGLEMEEGGEGIEVILE